ncbi:MAG: PD40 domain-containing protein, partial [Candidatus Brocadiae bacterium]|nr:PD40 domain-containing protein [Candidatus Brocadiia bacterium]
DEIDPYLVYRRINVLYEEYLRMGIYQRDLRQWDEVANLDNRAFGLGCVNCHTFFDKGTERMAIHFRSGQEEYGLGMLLIQDGVVSKIDARTRYSPRPAAYTSWHPSGRLVAFSVNKVVQFFHQARTEVRDALDLESDMGLYFVDGQEVASTPSISDPDVLESWPEWSPDGHYLYFCRAPMLWSDRKTVPPENFEKLKYDLVRISYDLGRNTWGELETVLAAEQTGLSISQPRFSPDGRFLVFCMSDYSTFPSFQASSDLYLMEVETGRYERMGCNSERSESWHCWSSNSRWMVFSSKRSDGQFIRAYFSYIDEDGVAHKAFVLPQKDPAFYDSFIKLYQIPELTTGPVRARGEKLARMIRTSGWTRVDLAVTSATPAADAEPITVPAPARPETGPWRAYRP